jgi:hypothetical protein
VRPASKQLRPFLAPRGIPLSRSRATSLGALTSEARNRRTALERREIIGLNGSYPLASGKRLSLINASLAAYARAPLYHTHGVAANHGRCGTGLGGDQTSALVISVEYVKGSLRFSGPVQQGTDRYRRWNQPPPSTTARSDLLKASTPRSFTRASIQTSRHPTAQRGSWATWRCQPRTPVYHLE